MSEDMVGGPSTVFTRKAVVGEIHRRDPTKWCKTISGNDVSQLYPYSLCRAMSAALYTRCELDFELGKFKPRQNKTNCFENMVMSNFQRVRPHRKVESFYKTGIQQKTDAYVNDRFCGQCKLCLKIWVVFIFIAHVKNFVLLSLKKKFNGENRES